MKKLFQGVFVSAMAITGAVAAGHIMHVELFNGNIYSFAADSVKQVTYTLSEDSLSPVDPYAGYEEIRSFDLEGNTFKMIKVEGGTFLMGAQSTDPSAPNYDSLAKENEGPVHSVTLSTYYMAQYETTCNLVRSLGITAGMGSESDKPIRNIYRKDVMLFVEKLNAYMHENGQLDEDENFTFPTEAQWEYAARGGKYSHGYIYAGSNNYNDVAYCRENSDHYSFTKVGSFAPNELGLYDMSGNCFEMCLDEWGSYSEDTQVDPQGPAVVTDSTKWVLRGGSFYEPASSSRVTYRGGLDANTETNSFSLRLALVKGNEKYEGPIAPDTVAADTSYKAIVDSLVANDPYADSIAVRSFDLEGDTFKMIKVEGGSFLMGAQSKDSLAPNYDPEAKGNESPVHRVCLSTFYMAQFETTCNLVRNLGITAGMGSESDKPIRNIYRNELLFFVEKLNAYMHENGQLGDYEYFTFPTEAQWEYAARGGKYSHGYIYAGSNNYNDVAYCKENSDHYSFTKVGSFAPNELGLYDMSGNCYEMCIDQWGSYSTETQVNPQGPAVVTDSTKWILRGGSFYEPAIASRVTYRGNMLASTQTNSFSLRLALVKGNEKYVNPFTPDTVGKDTSYTAIDDTLDAVDPYADYAEIRSFDLKGDTFKMIKVEGDTFLMGAQSIDSLAPNYDTLARENEGPVHRVVLSTFYMAQFETTCNLVRSLGITAGMGSESDMPIRNIYRSDVLRFVEKLNAYMHENGQLDEDENFTFPTEAQWEYAARGGKYSHGYIYAGSNNYNDVAYCRENSDHYSFTKVGSFAPNELGLYDMSGNCFEMCLDEWGSYSEDTQVDPQGPAVVTDSTKWVLRGGSFYEPASSSRVTYRGGLDANTETNSFSLRLALVKNKKIKK